jgi:P27 family predicted phage terminase small subunit
MSYPRLPQPKLVRAAYNKANAHASSARTALRRTPKPPATLTAEGRAHWMSWAPGLRKRGVLVTEDLPAFKALCRLAAVIDTLQATFEKEGVVITGSRGRSMIHPAYRAWRSQMPLYLALLAEFGLSPASRGKLIARGVGFADDDDAKPWVDPLDEILRRHRTR